MVKIRAAESLENEYLAQKREQERNLFKNRQFLKKVIGAGRMLGLTTDPVFLEEVEEVTIEDDKE